MYSNYLQVGLHNLHKLISVKKRKPHRVQLLACDAVEKKRFIDNKSFERALKTLNVWQIIILIIKKNQIKSEIKNI